MNDQPEDNVFPGEQYDIDTHNGIGYGGFSRTEREPISRVCLASAVLAALALLAGCAWLAYWAVTRVF